MISKLFKDIIKRPFSGKNGPKSARTLTGVEVFILEQDGTLRKLELNTLASFTQTAAGGAAFQNATSDTVVDGTDLMLIYDIESGTVKKVTRNVVLGGLIGALVPRGTFSGANGTINGTATLLSSLTPVDGDMYIVDADGSSPLGGISSWLINDYLFYAASAWHKIGQSALVTSVMGQRGPVTGLVQTTGDQNIAGTKTFTTGIIIDSIQTPDGGAINIEDVILWDATVQASGGGASGPCLRIGSFDLSQKNHGYYYIGLNEFGLSVNGVKQASWKNTGLELVNKLTAKDATFTTLPSYNSDAAAATGGLTQGMVYQTSTGEIRIKL